MTEDIEQDEQSEQKIPFEVIRARRAGARLAAVQALYQMEATGQSGRSVVREFCDDRLGAGPDGEPVEEADPDIFKSIIEAAVAKQAEIDPAITAKLSKNWKLSRLDATTRAILRGATAELIVHQELSVAIILDEYVSVAHAFFDGEEPRFVNAVLDNIAKEIRANG